MRFTLALLLCSAAFADDLVPDKDNLAVGKSGAIAKGDYTVADADGNGVVRITANDVVLDFQGATLSSGAKSPDARDGIGVRIENANNVTIRNANIRGYRFGISALNCEGLTLENCDVSESRAQHLHSRPDADKTGEDFLNLRDVNAWREYGAGIWLEGCAGASVNGCQGHHGQNGVLLVNSKKCRVLENDFSFNSGWGIGLYGATDNLVAYNLADFCLRACCWPAYGSGADSAALVVVAGSDRNWLVANSLTHSGDGFFLTNRRDIGDPDDGACNDNVVAYNDGSWTPANCFEATFSKRNVFVGNKAEFGGWGYWLGFSSDNLLVGNEISEIRSSGVGIEHGSGNNLWHNRIEFCSGFGVELWAIDDPKSAARAAHPSGNYRIVQNLIRGCSGSGVSLNMTDKITLEDNTLCDDATALFLGKDVTRLGARRNTFQSAKVWDQNNAAGKTARFSLGKEQITDQRAARTVDGVRSGGEAFEPHWAPGDYYELDLGQETKVNLILLFTRSIDPYCFLFDYTVLASKSGAFKGEEKELLHVANHLNQRVQPIAFPTLETRFLRIVSKTTQDWVGIAEIEVYAAAQNSVLRRGLTGTELWVRGADGSEGDVDLKENYWDDALRRDIGKMLSGGKLKFSSDHPLTAASKVAPALEDPAPRPVAGSLDLLRSGSSDDLRRIVGEWVKAVTCAADTKIEIAAPSTGFHLRRETKAPCGLDLMRCDEWGPVEPKKK